MDVSSQSFVEDPRQAARCLIAGQDRERRRIARDLHDGLGQDLALLALELRCLEAARELEDDLKRRLSSLADQLGELAKKARRFSHELHPARLELLGFTLALKSMCVDLSRYRKLHVDVVISPGLDRDLSTRVAFGLYRIAQEALHNVARHARVRQARLRLQRWRGVVWMSIEDEGIGFDLDRVEPGLGLVGMRERADLLGGELRLETAAGGGTRLSVTVPLSDR